MTERQSLMPLPDIVIMDNSDFLIHWKLKQIQKADKETHLHVLRSTELATRLAKIVGFSDIDLIRRGAMLHDIGKLDREVLALVLKATPLSDSEFEIIKKHPVYGEQEARQLGFVKELALIRWHHENWDGTGYPDGLRGEEIPFLARIMRVVDAYESMRGRRRFQNPFSKDKALHTMLKGDRCGFGRAFDPDLLQPFLRLEKSLPIDFFDHRPCQDRQLYVTL